MMVFGGSAATAVLSVTADTRAAQTSVGGLTNRINQMGPAGKIAAAGIAGIGVAGAGIAAKLTSDFFQATGELRKLRDITNLSAEELSTLGFVGKQTGTDIEDIGDAVREMQLRLVEARELGSGPAIDSLQVLGVTLEDLEGKTPTEQFAHLRQALSEVEDASTRVFLAEELLGGSSERLQGLLSLTADEYSALRQEATDTGAVIGDDTVDAAERASQAISSLTSTLQGLFADVMTPLLPVLEAGANAISKIASVAGGGITFILNFGAAITDGGESAADLENRLEHVNQRLNEETGLLETVGSRWDIYGDRASQVMREQIRLGYEMGQAIDDSRAAVEGFSVDPLANLRRSAELTNAQLATTLSLGRQMVGVFGTNAPTAVSEVFVGLSGRRPGSLSSQNLGATGVFGQIGSLAASKSLGFLSASGQIGSAWSKEDSEKLGGIDEKARERNRRMMSAEERLQQLQDEAAGLSAAEVESRNVLLALEQAVESGDMQLAAVYASTNKLLADKIAAEHEEDRAAEAREQAKNRDNRERMFRQLSRNFDRGLFSAVDAAQRKVPETYQYGGQTLTYAEYQALRIRLSGGTVAHGRAHGVDFAYDASPIVVNVDQSSAIVGIDDFASAVEGAVVNGIQAGRI